MSQSYEYPEEVEVVGESDSGKALLIKDPSEDKAFWVPKSGIHADSEVFKPIGVNSYGRLIVKMWLAEEKGWL